MFTVKDFEKALEQKYVFPGCYEKFFFSVTGAVTCFDCAKEEKEEISDSIIRDIYDDWHIHEIELDCNLDPEVYCDHCARRIV